MDKSNQNITVQDVAVDGKYNPALFVPGVLLGRDGRCAAVVQKGLETIDARHLVQEALIHNGKACSKLFQMRNCLASELKIATASLCSYCGGSDETVKQTDEKNEHKLWLYITIANESDPILAELSKLKDKKESVFKGALVWSLETKVRDVRLTDPLIVNEGCVLIALTRCSKCMKNE